MDQSDHMSKEPSPTAHTPESSPSPAQLLPTIPSESATERQSNPISSHSATSSPPEPFPELDTDLELGAEPNPSPTFAHEADMCSSPAVLSLPGPAVQRTRESETGPVIQARVTWAEEQDSDEERGDMREATARALGWAKKMFGKDAERRVEDGDGPGHGHTE